MDRRTLRALAVGIQFGISVVASVVIAMGGGYLLDEWLNTRPLFLLLGILVGIVAALYTIYELSRRFNGGRSRPKDE